MITSFTPDHCPNWRVRYTHPSKPNMVLPILGWAVIGPDQINTENDIDPVVIINGNPATAQGVRDAYGYEGWTVITDDGDIVGLPGVDKPRR